MPSCPGIEGCLSMSILTSLTLPLAALTTFSSTGTSCLHGPHHSAQKSTSTGWRLDSSITSLTKVWVVVSLTTAAAVASPPCNIVILLVLRLSFPDPAGRPGASDPVILPPQYAGLDGVGGDVCNRESLSPGAPVPPPARSHWR